MAALQRTHWQEPLVVGWGVGGSSLETAILSSETAVSMERNAHPGDKCLTKKVMALDDLLKAARPGKKKKLHIFRKHECPGAVQRWRPVPGATFTGSQHLDLMVLYIYGKLRVAISVLLGRMFRGKAVSNSMRYHVRVLAIEWSVIRHRVFARSKLASHLHMARVG